jgi:catechol 2,3-dioxygenase-like lactoylglutathione lyase family enzyme
MRQRAMVSLAVLAALAGTVPFELHAHGGAAVQSATSTDAAQPPVPIVGIAQVTFKTADLAKSRAYYQGVLGLPEAFTVKDDVGVTSAYFKVNDDQYVEITPTLKPGELIRQARVVFESTDLKKLHATYAERGLNPSAITTGPDGNPVFRVKDPEDNTLDFLQYVPSSKQGRARGKLLTPDRLSTHLWHVGIMSKDRAKSTPFYKDMIGLENGRNVPGGRGEYVELPASDRNLETKDPPLDPENPATKDQYTREVYGAVYHMALEVKDARATRDLLQKRGNYSDVRVRATVGNNRHWLIHMFDPDGTRAEIMETALQTDVASGSIMAKNPNDPPIAPPPGTGRGGRGGAAQAGTPPAATPAPQAPTTSTTPPAARVPAQTGRGGGGGRYVEADPIKFDDHAGWTQMFDGKTLNGWDGPTDLWHVQDGAIVVQSKAEPPTGSVYLLYTGSEPQDFEFKFEVKLDGAGANSGVQFRASRLGEEPNRPRSKWETRGYQADFDNANSNVGALIECCSGASRNGVRPRPDRAKAGQVVRAAVAEGQMPQLLATFSDAATLTKAYKPGEWNQMHLVARGRTMMFFINGALMSVFIDDHPTKFLPKGVLSIQLEGRGDNTAAFRNLWLKNLQ